MRIGCLQFAPQVGDVHNNMNRADAVLSRANTQNLDLLVLPELAFSGCTFSSLEHISPYLEYTASGITSLWARTTALKYECVVTVGYPEKVETERWPASPEYYNSAIIVNKDGETIANYRKTFLYSRDEAWALEGPNGFFHGVIPSLGTAAMGICMDLNPYRFQSPWNAWEFANHILHRQANLVILSMAWVTDQDYSSYSRKPTSPDLGTLSYWVARFEPLIRAEDRGEVIVVIASRSGAEGNTVFAGTSCVLGIEDGEVKVYGILGRGQKGLLVVDTKNPPQFKLVAEKDTPIYEDKAQSREASKLDTKEFAPRNSNGPDTPYPSDQGPPLGLEAAFAEITAVSPVEPLSSHAFFGSQPLGRRRSSTTSSESSNAATPIASTVSSPISILGQPNSPDSARGDRSPSEPSPTSQERLEKMLHIASVFDRHTEHHNASAPDSASSMTVNMDWERPSNTFRGDQFIKVTPPSPSVESSIRNGLTLLTPPVPEMPANFRRAAPPVQPSIPQMPARDRGKHTSQPTVTITETRNYESSHPPRLKAPQLPRPRNPGRTRPVQRQPTIASHDLIVETARAGVVVPIGAIQIRPARYPTVDSSTGMTHRAAKAVRKARSLSPPPTPATAIWTEDKTLWRESQLW